MRRVLLLGAIAILVVAVAVLSAVPLKSVVYSETEPYTTTETYYVTETHVQEVPLDFEVIDTNIGNFYWQYASNCTVTLRNTDVESGYFRVEFDMVTQPPDMSHGKTITKAGWQFLAPGKQADITLRHEGDWILNFTHSITPPTKQVTTSEQVAKTREITDYREVLKTKKQTFLEYWTS